jgi:hypothetical protein
MDRTPNVSRSVGTDLLSSVPGILHMQAGIPLESTRRLASPHNKHISPFSLWKQFVFDLRHHGPHKEPIVSLLRQQQSPKTARRIPQMLSQCLTSSPPLLQPEYERSFCQLAKSSAQGSSALWKDYNLKMSCDWGISVQMDGRTEVRICPESLGSASLNDAKTSQICSRH